MVGLCLVVNSEQHGKCDKLPYRWLLIRGPQHKFSNLSSLMFIEQDGIAVGFFVL